MDERHQSPRNQVGSMKSEINSVIKESEFLSYLPQHSLKFHASSNGVVAYNCHLIYKHTNTTSMKNEKFGTMSTYRFWSKMQALTNTFTSLSPMHFIQILSLQKTRPSMMICSWGRLNLLLSQSILLCFLVLIWLYDKNSLAIVNTTTQTLLEAGIFDFPRRAKPSAAA